MSQNTLATAAQEKDQDDDHGASEVTISVDGHSIHIHRGATAVAAIKAAGKVPAADELEQVIHGKLVPLADDGKVVLKGEEVFVSHPRDGASS